jgi:hypothetical protein
MSLNVNEDEIDMFLWVYYMLQAYLCFVFSISILFEYVFFIEYIYKIYVNYDDYLVLEVGSIDIGYSNTLEIWIM